MAFKIDRATNINKDLQLGAWRRLLCMLWALPAPALLMLSPAFVWVVPMPALLVAPVGEVLLVPESPAQGSMERSLPWPAPAGLHPPRSLPAPVALRCATALVQHLAAAAACSSGLPPGHEAVLQRHQGQYHAGGGDAVPQVRARFLLAQWAGSSLRAGS